MAQLIGSRFTECLDKTETVFRLDRPVLDVAPDWRNVMVVVRNGVRSIHRARAWEDADGSWQVVPGAYSDWLACYSPLSARALEAIEIEIAR